MNTQPNWAQQAAAAGQKKGVNKNIIWGAVGVVALLGIAIAIALTTTDSSDTATGVNVEVSRSAQVDGTPLEKAPDGAGLFDVATDPAVGKTIPTITATQIDGTPYTIKPGKPTLFVFIAHWCPHCQAEVPRMVEWTNASLVPKTVDIVAVSTSADKNQNNFPPSKWLSREKWPYPAVADTTQRDIANAFAVSGFPYFVAVDGAGKVVQRGSGELTQEQFTQILGQIAPK